MYAGLLGLHHSLMPHFQPYCQPWLLQHPSSICWWNEYSEIRNIQNLQVYETNCWNRFSSMFCKVWVPGNTKYSFHSGNVLPFQSGLFITIILTLNTTTLQTRSILRYNYSAGWPWEEEINFNILVRTLPQYFSISDPPAFRDLTLTFSSLKLYESSATCSQELFAYQNLHPFSYVPYLK